MNTCPGAQTLFSAKPAPDVFLSHVASKGGLKTYLPNWWTTHSQIWHSYGMGCGMSALRVFASAHVAAKGPTDCNRNNGVSVAPALNDTFYQSPHPVSLKRYARDTWVGRA
jgi:hypothetical protein